MSVKAVVMQSSVVAVPVVDQVTNNGIITALSLENYVIWGFTFGALFQLLMFVSVLLIVIINLSKVVDEAKKMFSSVKGSPDKVDKG